MKIAISMISLNEKEHIKRAIASCGFADYICLIDGQSTDRTVQLASSMANKIGVKFIKRVKPWQTHFGEQRQAALQLVPEDADWWIRLDSDEQYSPLFQENIRALLESLPENCAAARIRQVNLIEPGIYSAARGGWETWPRIFRNIRHENKSAWMWEGQVHEYCRLMTLQGLIDPDAITLNLSVLHYGWLSIQRRQDREKLYATIPGSGFEIGSLVTREHTPRLLPELAFREEYQGRF